MIRLRCRCCGEDSPLTLPRDGAVRPSRRVLTVRAVRPSGSAGPGHRSLRWSGPGPAQPWRTPGSSMPTPGDQAREWRPEPSGHRQPRQRHHPERRRVPARRADRAIQLRDRKPSWTTRRSPSTSSRSAARIASQAPDEQPALHRSSRCNEGTINAFALPGGFIGVELRHGARVTQRVGARGRRGPRDRARHPAPHGAHFPRKRLQGIAQTAAILAAVLIGALAGGSGTRWQAPSPSRRARRPSSRSNFTRANEYEADRVGIWLRGGRGLRSGRHGLVLRKRCRAVQGLAGQYVPEMIQSHPVELEPHFRARSRARRSSTIRRATGFGDLRMHPRAACACSRCRRIRRSAERYAQDSQNFKGTLGQRYGMRAARSWRSSKNQEAAKILSDLVGEHENITLLHPRPRAGRSRWRPAERRHRHLRQGPRPLPAQCAH